MRRAGDGNVPVQYEAPDALSENKSANPHEGNLFVPAPAPVLA